MNENWASLILIAFIVRCASTLAVSSEPDYLNTMVTTADVLPIQARLTQVGSKSGIPFCLEYCDTDRALLKEARPLGGGKPITVKELISSLETAGYACKLCRSSVLVSTGQARGLKDNPLDTNLDGFTFKGDHAAFVQKIGSLFPGVRPDLFNLSGTIGADVSYNIKIEGAVSIRDVMMEVASQYGTAWDAQIRAVSPAYEIKGSDGSVTQTKGSRVLLSFQNLKPQGKKD